VNLDLIRDAQSCCRGTLHSFQVEYKRNSQAVFKLLGKQINVIIEHKKEAIRVPKKWVLVFKLIYLAYLLLDNIYFDHKVERSFPFPHSITQSSTISCNCFSTSSMDWQPSTTCFKPVEFEGKKPKNKA